MKDELRRQLKATREASRVLVSADDAQLSAVLTDLAALARANRIEILAANAIDLKRMDTADPKYDRLLLDEARLDAICQDLERVAAMPSPLGQILDQRTLDNGLELTKLSVPLGVVAVIFESRPNVAFDVFALCLKSGNACVLKGSRDARDSNRIIVELIHQALQANDLPDAVARLAPSQREALPVVLEAVDDIDIAIPRGSQGLIDFVRDHAKVPVIETGAGVVHTYVDESADLEKAEAIVFNAKTRRVSVCNALDTLLLHRTHQNRLPELTARMGREHQVKIHADPEAFAILDGHYPGPLVKAEPDDFGREFLAYSMSLRIVDDLDMALDHIARHSSRHSEAVIAEDAAVIETFLNRVDAAAVYANASTAFTDGGQFGMGAEIGISTQKLHARGPMALAELTSYKWTIRGQGQTRA